MRDRARNGAPEAVQIADRFHLLMNVTTAMTRCFERKYDTLKHIYEQEKALDPPVPPPFDTDPPARPLSVSLQQRWSEGARNVTHLVAELRKQGYRGSETIVFDYLRPLHEKPEWLAASQQQQQRAAQGKPTEPLSAREAAWLFVCPPPTLTLAQVRQLDPLRTRDEELGKAYELVQDFRTMLTRRQLAFLPCWIEEAKDSGLPELRRFAEGGVTSGL